MFHLGRKYSSCFRVMLRKKLQFIMIKWLPFHHDNWKASDMSHFKFLQVHAKPLEIKSWTFSRFTTTVLLHWLLKNIRSNGFKIQIYWIQVANEVFSFSDSTFLTEFGYIPAEILFDTRPEIVFLHFFPFFKFINK